MKNTAIKERLQPPDSHYLSAAMGWLELGDAQEAQAELSHINPIYHDRADVLLVRYGVCAKLGDWKGAAELAKQVAVLIPTDPAIWIVWAYAQRRSSDGGIPGAKEILREAQTRFPSEPTIAYNLACYDCQLGRIEDAVSWLRRAIEIGDRAQMKKMALRDPDLEPLRSRLKEL